MLGLKFESSPVKTVGEDRLERKEFFFLYRRQDWAEMAKSTMATQVNQSFYKAQAGMKVTLRSFG